MKSRCRRVPVSVPLLVLTTAIATALSACSGTVTATTLGTTVTTPADPSAAPTSTSTPGNASTTEAPTTTVEPDRAAAVFAYEFPPGKIDLNGLEQPTRYEAVVGLPQSGAGPFPVVVIVHGVGPACTSGLSEADLSKLVTATWSPPCVLAGSDYVRAAFANTSLVNELAQRGIAAISMDVNGAYNWWGGEVPEGLAIASLVAEHLDTLDRIASGDMSIDGLTTPVSLDRDRWALIGHSRGGAFAEAQLAEPDGQQDRLSSLPDAVVLLASAGHYSPPATGVPLLNIRSTCDEDVGPEAGIDTATSVAALGADPVVDATIAGASHWSLTSYPLRAATVDCADRLDDGALANAQVVALVASFLSSVWRDSFELEVDEELVAVDTLSGAVTIVEPQIGELLSPAIIPIHLVGEQVLPPIEDGDRFLDETEIEDF